MPFHESKRAVWIGGHEAPDLASARSAVAARMDLTIVPWSTALVPPGDAPDGVDAGEPLFVFLALDTPARFASDHAVAIARRWPLCRIIAVGASLAEGRRRSGPPLPGIEEVPWYELPGRLERWLDHLRDGRPGTIGLPATVRREDRLLEMTPVRTSTGRRVELVAPTRDALDGLAALLEAIGCPAVASVVGTPPIAPRGNVVVWDVGGSIARHLPWLRLLSANRPETDIVVLESFPRGDRSLEAVHAGAACVLGRPPSAEALAGTLDWLGRCRGNGLGAAGPAR